MWNSIVHGLYWRINASENNLSSFTVEPFNMQMAHMGWWWNCILPKLLTCIDTINGLEVIKPFRTVDYNGLRWLIGSVRVNVRWTNDWFPALSILWYKPNIHTWANPTYWAFKIEEKRQKKSVILLINNIFYFRKLFFSLRVK